MNKYSKHLPSTAEQEEQLRAQVLQTVREYYQYKFPPHKFVPGQSNIPVSGKVFDEEELCCLIDCSLDFWLTTGRYAKQFEMQMAEWLGVEHCVLVNSGSSANLLALSALTSPKLGERRLKPGDEVITVAAGFPTTVNPIFQNQLIPVFLDVTVPTYGIDISLLKASLSPRTRAIMIAHTLGNPFDIHAVMEFAQKHNLWVIEDNCDALGSLYKGQKTGSFGHMGTLSFYPAHHITMGEGGAVITNDLELKGLVASLRDWGRDCHCSPGHDNTCGKRFELQLGDLPFGYDHKYIFSHIGYNLKVTDMQAAIGCAQLHKLSGFIAQRRYNFHFLHDQLRDLQDFFILPEATPASEPSWFGFPLMLKDPSRFSRYEIIHHLENHHIGTRLLFGGNLVKQPAYKELTYRVVGNLPNSDDVMNHAFWVGVFPGLTEEMLSYMASCIRDFCFSLLKK